MSWLLFYLLAALHPVAFIAIGIASKTWKTRLWLWALLPIPAVLYCWNYFVIKHEHEHMCAAEGGLRVVMQPEKADRIRLVGNNYDRGDAKTLISLYFPALQVVESMSVESSGNGKEVRNYVAITAAPNPRAGQQSMTHAADKEGPYTFPESRGTSWDASIYEIREYEASIPHGTRKETRLSKGGELFAKYTEIVHWWTGIQYPDALPTWRCPDQRRPDTPILHYEPLVKLILK